MKKIDVNHSGLFRSYEVELCSPAGVKLNIKPFPPAQR